MRGRLILLAGLCALGAPTPGQAQIYSWQDANGNFVLSDRPRPADARTFAVPHTRSIRTTRPAIARFEDRYDDLITYHASANSVRPELVRAVIQTESAFNPRARSSKGAMGLMQLMPDTAAQFGVTNPYNPAESIGTLSRDARLRQQGPDVHELPRRQGLRDLQVDRHHRTAGPFPDTPTAHRPPARARAFERRDSSLSGSPHRL